MAIYFLKGIVIGLVCGTPVGVAGAMTIQRTLKFGVKQGLITGLGSSVADCIFAAVGVFGLTFVSDFLSLHQSFINIIGGIVSLFMGFSIFNKKETEYKSGDGFRHFISTFTVGITNPVAIVAFIIAFSYMEIQGSTTAAGGLAVLGVFVGTYIWWIVLTGATYFAKKKSRQDILNKINTGLGCLLIALGAFMIIRGIRSL